MANAVIFSDIMAHLVTRVKAGLVAEGFYNYTRRYFGRRLSLARR